MVILNERGGDFFILTVIFSFRKCGLEAFCVLWYDTNKRLSKIMKFTIKRSTDEKFIVTNARLPEHVHTQMADLAADLRISRNALMVQALREFIVKHTCSWRPKFDQEN